MTSKRKISFLACFSAWMVVIAAVSNCYCAPAFEKPAKAEVSHCSHHSDSNQNSQKKPDCAPRYISDLFEATPHFFLKDQIPFLSDMDRKVVVDQSLADFSLSFPHEAFFLVFDSPPTFYLLHHAFLI